jgi:hypothetical protein
MRNALQKNVDKIKTHTLCSVFSPRKSCRLRDKVEKYGGVREAADGTTAARFVLD